MKNKNAALGVLVALAFSALLLVSAPAHAILVTPFGQFTNFYTALVLDTTGDSLVVNRVNGQQLCAFGPAQDGQTTYDCSLDGPAGMELAPGTTSVEWQVLPIHHSPWLRNLVSFRSAGPQEVGGIGPAHRFLFGTLTFENGQWSSAYAELSFELSFSTNDPDLNELFDFEYSGTLVIMGTVNRATNTPEQNADFIYLASDPQLGSLRAYELFDSPTGTNVVSVDIWGYLSSVHFDSFRNARGGGFIDSGIDLEPSGVPVPEPSPLVLLGLGLAVLGMASSRKQG